MVVTLCWIHAPRWVSTGCYLAVGWIAVLALPSLWSALGPGDFGLLAAGAVLYTVGAVVYARKRPDPWPQVFGYHEVFHALTVVGATAIAIVKPYVLGAFGFACAAFDVGCADARDPRRPARSR